MHSHPNKTKPGHIPLCPCAGSSSCLILHLKSLSGRSESLTSPPIFLGVRDLHSNGWALSTGEPDEQSRVVVLLPRTASAFCYSPPPGSGSCLSVCSAGWRLISVLWSAVLLLDCVCSSVCMPHCWKQCVCVCVYVKGRFFFFLFFSFETDIIASATTCSPVEALGSADCFISMHSINHSQ